MKNRPDFKKFREKAFKNKEVVDEYDKIKELPLVHEEGCDGYHCTCKLKNMPKATVTELIPNFEVEIDLEDDT